MLIENYLYQLTAEEKLGIYKEIVHFEEFSEEEKEEEIRLIDRKKLKTL